MSARPSRSLVRAREVHSRAGVGAALPRRRAKLGGNHWNGLPVILPRRGLERERVDAWLEEQGAHPDVYAEVDGNEAILALVALGCGVGVVPELVRKDSPLRGRLEQVEVRRHVVRRIQNADAGEKFRRWRVQRNMYRLQHSSFLSKLLNESA